jgi:hypothetical protein
MAADPNVGDDVKEVADGDAWLFDPEAFDVPVGKLEGKRQGGCAVCIPEGEDFTFAIPGLAQPLRVGHDQKKVRWES